VTTPETPAARAGEAEVRETRRDDAKTTTSAVREQVKGPPSGVSRAEERRPRDQVS